MTTHPNVNPGGIATIGVSKGTELISYMSIYSPLVNICIYKCTKYVFNMRTIVVI